MKQADKKTEIVKILKEHRYDAFSQDTPVSCICGADCYEGKGTGDRIANHIATLILAVK